MEALLEEQSERCKRLHEANQTSKKYAYFSILVSTPNIIFQMFHLKMHYLFLLWLWRNLKSLLRTVV